MSHFNKVAAVLVSLGALALGGCGGSSSDSSTVSVDTAKAAAVASFAKAINAAGNSISTVTNNSTATNVVVGKSVVNIPLSARAQADVLDRFKKISSSPALRTITAARTVNGVAATPTTVGVTEEELKQYFGTATQVGNTITYTINADAVCAGINDPYTTINEETECRSTVARITLVQTVVNATSGTLTLKVDAAAPLVIGYDASSVYLEIDLAGIKAAAIALDSTASTDFPTTMVGALRLTVTVTNATVGAESAAIKLGITTAINVAGTSSDGAYNLQMAAADKLFEIAADVVAKTATVTVGVGLVHFEFPDYDLSAMRPSLFHLGGLTGTFALNNNTNMLTGTNVGITGEMKVDDDTTDTSTGSVVTLAAFDFTVNGATSVVKFTKALAFQINDALVGTVDDGSFSASATASTEVQVTNTATTSTNKVIAGQVTLTGLGAYADGGPIIATPSSNSCFKEDYLTNFGYALVGCPL